MFPILVALVSLPGGLLSRGLDATSKDARKGAPRNWSFSSHPKPKTTKHNLYLETTRVTQFRGPGPGKREEDPGKSREDGPSKPIILPVAVPGFSCGGEDAARSCSASENSFERGPCSKWPARREHDPTGDRKARSTSNCGRPAWRASGVDRARSGQREETTATGDFQGSYFFPLFWVGHRKGLFRVLTRLLWSFLTARRRRGSLFLLGWRFVS